MHKFLKDSRFLVGRGRMVFGRHVLMSKTDVLPQSSIIKQQFATRQWL